MKLGIEPQVLRLKSISSDKYVFLIFSILNFPKEPVDNNSNPVSVSEYDSIILSIFFIVKALFEILLLTSSSGDIDE